MQPRMEVSASWAARSPAASGGTPGASSCCAEILLDASHVVVGLPIGEGASSKVYEGTWAPPAPITRSTSDDILRCIGGSASSSGTGGSRCGAPTRMTHSPTACDLTSLARQQHSQEPAMGQSTPVAVKVLKPHLLQNRVDCMRFIREAQTMSTLSHRAIASCHGIGRHGASHPRHPGALFIVQELLEGPSLACKVHHAMLATGGGAARCCNSDTPASSASYSTDEALGWLVDVAEGMEYLHSRGGGKHLVIHRDLKLENIMLSSHAYGAPAKLVDLGLHRVVDSQVGRTTIRRTPSSCGPFAGRSTKSAGCEGEQRAAVLRGCSSLDRAGGAHAGLSVLIPAARGDEAAPQPQQLGTRRQLQWGQPAAAPAPQQPQPPLLHRPCIGGPFAQPQPAAHATSPAPAAGMHVPCGGCRQLGLQLTIPCNDVLSPTSPCVMGGCSSVPMRLRTLPPPTPPLHPALSLPQLPEPGEDECECSCGFGGGCNEHGCGGSGRDLVEGISSDGSGLLARSDESGEVGAASPTAAGYSDEDDCYGDGSGTPRLMRQSSMELLVSRIRGFRSRLVAGVSKAFVPEGSAQGAGRPREARGGGWMPGTMLTASSMPALLLGKVGSPKASVLASSALSDDASHPCRAQQLCEDGAAEEALPSPRLTAQQPPGAPPSLLTASLMADAPLRDEGGALAPPPPQRQPPAVCGKPAAAQRPPPGSLAFAATPSPLRGACKALLASPACGGASSAGPTPLAPPLLGEHGCCTGHSAALPLLQHAYSAAAAMLSPTTMHGSWVAAPASARPMCGAPHAAPAPPLHPCGSLPLETRLLAGPMHCAPHHHHVAGRSCAAQSVQRSRPALPRALPWVTDVRYNLTGGVGSFAYQAPELTLGAPYNESVDVFAFGVVAWELLCRRLLLADSEGGEGGDARAAACTWAERVARGHRPELPAEWPAPLAELVANCWAQDPHERPSFRLVLERLKKLHINGSMHAMDAAAGFCRAASTFFTPAPQGLGDPKTNHTPTSSEPVAKRIAHCALA